MGQVSLLRVKSSDCGSTHPPGNVQAAHSTSERLPVSNKVGTQSRVTSMNVGCSCVRGQHDLADVVLLEVVLCRQ